MFKLALFVLVLAIIQINSLPITEEKESTKGDLEQYPCKGKSVGDRLKHPTDDHKFLRCVSADTVWIETCPDNLFYNSKQDVCDWSTETMSTTTIPTNEVVKNRAVLFKITKDNKLVEQKPRNELLITLPPLTVAPTTESTTTEFVPTTTTTVVNEVLNVSLPTTTPLQMKVNFKSFFEKQAALPTVPVSSTLSTLITSTTVQPSPTSTTVQTSPVSVSSTVQPLTVSSTISTLTTPSTVKTLAEFQPLPLLPLLPKLPVLNSAPLTRF